MGFETLLYGIWNLVIFIVVLSVLIVVHEWGHFITAKKLGVDVQEFSLGFGPTLFSKVFNGTNYLIKAIPLGGYVKMAGDERSNCKGLSTEFFSKSPGHRSLVVLNGPVVNFVLAYVCLVFVFILGYPDLSTKVGEVKENYPAYHAGLLVGDEVVAIDGEKIYGWSELQKAVAESENESLSLDVIREGKTFGIALQPRVDQLENIFGQVQQRKIIGIGPKEEVVTFKFKVGESFVKAFQKMVEITVLTYKSLYFMLTGAMSPKESMTGPVGIFYIISSAAAMGFSHLLYIVGVISASLAIFNLLPVIPLDGGHLLLFGIEKIRGKALSAKTDEYLTRIGFGLFIMLAVFVFYNDFARFGWIDKLKSFIN
jgi:regulator of sigma E protease